MKTIIYKKIESKLLQDWVYLWENSPYANYVNSPYWFLSVMENFKYKDYVIICVYKSNHLAALVALIKEKKYCVDFYTVPPGDFVCGTPFLVDPKDAKIMRVLVKKLLETGNIFIDNVPEDIIACLKKNTSEIDFASYSLNYYMSLHKDETGQVFIRNKKKLMRRAHDIEEKLKLKSFNGENPDILKIAFAIDQESRKKTRGYNAFSCEDTKGFYGSLAKHFKKNLLINILYNGNKPIAYEMGFVVGSTFFCSQISSLKEYDRYSLGRVLLIKLFEDLVTKNVNTIDFGSGDDHVKKSFTKEYRALYKVIISKKIVIRNYLKITYQCKNIMFNYLQHHMTAYSLYRNIKTLLIIRA